VLIDIKKLCESSNDTTFNITSEMIRKALQTCKKCKTCENMHGGSLLMDVIAKFFNSMLRFSQNYSVRNEKGYNFHPFQGWE
jgi:hypothetical protein